ncbi:PHD finger protein 7-like [Pempheris klunzingeri]|uniref:PHD finger protein 7-like n=1 Tax=Pempheris klunzingeri TaxID=3127111 RepID=UPI00397F697B
MKKKKARRSRVAGGNQEECCALCRLADDDPAVFGEKVTLKEHKLSVHYFCLLTSCGVYQRGEEDEGVFGFLVDDIKQEIRRSARLTCCYCKKKGACVGCNVRSCRKTVHFPCGRKYEFISQFTEPFPSYCRDHSPSQSVSVGPDLSLPQSCSVCLDSIEPVLCYSVLKCPSCHNSWFHRDCVQRQAHSAGLFFFRCTLCNNKENFQEEMLRMGIFIPERDASWELEAEAYAELLVVYRRCDALTCLCNDGRTHSAKSGWFEVIRCRLCGSRGTHRKCSGLESDTRDWACSDCTQAADGRASLVSSPQRGQRRSLLSKRHPSPIHSPVSCKRQSEHCVVHCLLCEKPQDELLTHLARVCMKTSTPEERRAELQRAQQSVKEWTREARNWDYADMCLWIPHTPSRLALLEDLRRRNFFVANVPDSAHLDPGDERLR